MSDAPSKGPGQGEGHPRTPEAIGIELNVPEGTLRATLALPPRPIRLAELALGAMGLSEKLTHLAVQREQREGRAISCQKGCGACCRQVVPLSPPEAWLVADVVAGMRSPRREEVLAAFAHAGEVLERSGLDRQLAGRIETVEQMMGLALSYFALGVPCPFLRDESCSIYPYRPSICREYLVTSPPERCGAIDGALVRPGTAPRAVEPIARVPVHVRLSEALARLTAKLLGTEPEVVPLTLALKWAAAHGDAGQRTWDPRVLFEGLIAELSAGTG
jgi:Fe-S-cluster containining protein